MFGLPRSITAAGDRTRAGFIVADPELQSPARYGFWIAVRILC
jgi:hypothetical protein